MRKYLEKIAQDAFVDELQKLAFGMKFNLPSGAVGSLDVGGLSRMREQAYVLAHEAAQKKAKMSTQAMPKTIHTPANAIVLK